MGGQSPPRREEPSSILRGQKEGMGPLLPLRRSLSPREKSCCSRCTMAIGKAWRRSLSKPLLGRFYTAEKLSGPGFPTASCTVILFCVSCYICQGIGMPKQNALLWVSPPTEGTLFWNSKRRSHIFLKASGMIVSFIYFISTYGFSRDIDKHMYVSGWRRDLSKDLFCKKKKQI